MSFSRRRAIVDEGIERFASDKIYTYFEWNQFAGVCLF